MGIPTLITTNTITSGTGTSEFESSIDSTYDEYMFVVTDAHPANNSVNFQFQVNASGQSGYNETMTTTFFRAQHNESASPAQLGYMTSADQAEGTAFQTLAIEVNNDNDGSLAGVLHLFSPANTTHVTHFYSRFGEMFYGAGSHDCFAAGYINVTAAITNVQFKFAGGNIDNSVIQMYGIS